MARAPATPRKSTPSTQSERTAKRLARQQKQLEKELINEMTVKVTPNAGKMVKISDIKKLSPLTETQKHFFEAWENADADGYILHGTVGTGKSFMAVYFALLEILQQEAKYKKLIIIRSSVPTRDIGFLPGDLDEKMAVYEMPYVQICSELTNNKSAYEKLKETGKIEFISSSFLRGTTFRDCIVLVDEIQDLNWHELSTVVSRVGDNTILICCGDGKQDDLIKSKNDVSGFRDFLGVTRLMPEFRSFQFTTDDIVRSSFVKSWILACERLGL